MAEEVVENSIRGTNYYIPILELVVVFVCILRPVLAQVVFSLKDCLQLFDLFDSPSSFQIVDFLLAGQNSQLKRNVKGVLLLFGPSSSVGLAVSKSNDDEATIA